MAHHNENGYAWYQCKCCPYGYHIDLDFVRYCEGIGQHQVERSGSIKRRKDRRRQRQSMEVLLGLTPTPPSTVIPLTPISDAPPPPLPLLMHDELHDVVEDFERTLQRSKNKLSNNLPDVTAVSEPVRRAPSVSSMSTTSSSSSMTILQSAGDGGAGSGGGGGGRDFDTVSIESSTCGLSPAALHTIREQMALGLERTKELEEMVKLLPLLKAQIATLQDENKQLRADEEEITLNRLNSNYLIQSYTFGDSIDNTARIPPPPPRRDFGVSAAVLTRNVGVGHQTPHTKNVSTATVPDKKQHVDRWYAEKSKFLNGADSPPLLRSMRDSQTQTMNPMKETRNVATQSVNLFHKSVRDVGSQATIKSPVMVDSGINAVVGTTDTCVQFTPHTISTGVSDDTVDDILCAKCRLVKKSVAVNTSVSDALANDLEPPISLAALSATPRSKSFHLGESKLNMSRHRTVACQYECHNAGSSKSSQTETKTATKYCQHEYLQIHKSIQSEYHGQTKSTDTASLLPASVSQSTDTKGLAPVMKHKSCEMAPKVCEAACNTETATTTTTASQCAKCNNEEAEETEGKKDEAVTPSRIPRLQIPTTPVENRTYRRQDTYTKISSDVEQSPTRLSALELATKSISTEVSSPIEKVKEKYKLSSESLKPLRNDANDQTTTISSPTGSAISEGALCQPASPRKKCTPSKEMQAAMKVLHDSLQKHNGRDARPQLKNANAIIEQEWFNISSVLNADPLDVEDYLDSFEDVSSTLLQYVVNMVDASGNTAMHYAVSHGNFDVVSILLDSKVCDINRQNKAGYTSVMLVSLAEVRSHTHANVVRRLFSLSDVNIRAKQHGQTALMLAVSHGRLDMVAMLLEAGADINIQDEDGSTALMCAAEHGHVDIVKHFLSQPDCDSTIKDVDGSMALQIAMEAGHRHIGVLLYAHDRNQQGGNSNNAPVKAKKAKSTSASPKMPSSPLMQRSAHRALSTNK